MRRALAAALLAALVLGEPGPASAYFDDVSLGARWLSLGGASAAMVEDVSALYWNPAALSRLSRGDALSHYGKPYTADGLAAYGLGVGGRVARTGVALGWHRTSVADVYAEDLFQLSAGRTLLRSKGGHALAAGGSFKLGRVSTEPFSLDDGSGGATPFDFGSRSQLSCDVGLLWTTPWKLDFAWVGRDLNRPRYEFVAGSGGAEVPFTHELAATFRWNRESTVSASWKRIPEGGEGLAGASSATGSFNLGLEIWFYDVFALRSGFTDAGNIPARTLYDRGFGYTGGFGLKHRRWFVDGAVTSNRDLGASYSVSLRVPFGKVAAE